MSEQEAFSSHYYPKEREMKNQIVLSFSQGLMCSFCYIKRVGAILPTDFYTFLIRADPGIVSLLILHLK